MEASLGTIIGNILLVTGSVLVLFFLIKKYAWENISSTFEERARKISRDIDSAEEARQRAEVLAQKREEELVGSRKEAAIIVETAKEVAEKNKAALLLDAKSEAARLKDKAAQEIEQDKEEALASVKDEVAALTISLTEKILTQELTAEAHSDLIDRYINELGEA